MDQTAKTEFSEQITHHVFIYTGAREDGGTTLTGVLYGVNGAGVFGI